MNNEKKELDISRFEKETARNIVVLGCGIIVSRTKIDETTKFGDDFDTIVSHLRNDIDS
jgi:hypothetical protein